MPWNDIDYLVIKTTTGRGGTTRRGKLHGVSRLSIALPGVPSGPPGAGPGQDCRAVLEQISTACTQATGLGSDESSSNLVAPGTCLSAAALTRWQGRLAPLPKVLMMPGQGDAASLADPVELDVGRPYDQQKLGRQQGLTEWEASALAWAAGTIAPTVVMQI